MRNVFPQNFPLPDEYLIEMGRIATLWGSLEACVSLAINKLSGAPPDDEWRGYIISAHSNFQQKVDIISTLCEQLQPKYKNLAGYRDTIATVRAAQTSRNHFAHSGVVEHDQGVFVSTRLQARGKLKITNQTVTVSDLVEVSKKIHLALLSLTELITGVTHSPIWESD